MFVSVHMAGNLHTVCILFSVSNLYYKAVMGSHCCFFLERVIGLLVMSINCGRPLLVYQACLHT